MYEEVSFFDAMVRTFYWQHFLWGIPSLLLAAVGLVCFIFCLRRKGPVALLMLPWVAYLAFYALFYFWISAALSFYYYEEFAYRSPFWLLPTINSIVQIFTFILFGIVVIIRDKPTAAVAHKPHPVDDAARRAEIEATRQAEIKTIVDKALDESDLESDGEKWL